MVRRAKMKRRMIAFRPSTGMADIGLIILITFMCMSEMDKSDGGIELKMEPWYGDHFISLPPDELPEMYIIDINSRNQLMANAERIDFEDLKHHCRAYFYENLNSKAKEPKYVIVLLRINRSATYERYMQVLNEAVKVRNNYLNKIALKLFNKKYHALDYIQRRKVRFKNPIVIIDRDYKYIDRSRY